MNKLKAIRIISRTLISVYLLVLVQRLCNDHTDEIISLCVNMQQLQLNHGIKILKDYDCDKGQLLHHFRLLSLVLAFFYVIGQEIVQIIYIVFGIFYLQNQMKRFVMKGVFDFMLYKKILNACFMLSILLIGVFLRRKQ